MRVKSDAQRQFEAATGWLELGNWREANEELEQLSPENRTSSDALKLRCRIYTMAGKWEDLESIADGARRLHPADEIFHTNLAWAQLKLGRPNDASETVTVALGLFETSAELALVCACVDAAGGRPVEAREWLAIALSIDASKAMKLRALALPELEPVWRADIERT